MACPRVQVSQERLAPHHGMIDVDAAIMYASVLLDCYPAAHKTTRTVTPMKLSECSHV